MSLLPQQRPFWWHSAIEAVALHNVRALRNAHESLHSLLEPFTACWAELPDNVILDATAIAG